MFPVAIRPYRPDDVPALCAAAVESQPVLYPWMPWCHPKYNLTDAQGWIPGAIERFAKSEDHQFAVISAAGEFLGGCGINGINREDGFANLGYWVRSSAMGRGVAPAAVRLVRDWVFANTELGRLEIVVAAENARSARVAEKAGAEFEGLLRSRIRLHGRAHDARLYSLVR